MSNEIGIRPRACGGRFDGIHLPIIVLFVCELVDSLCARHVNVCDRVSMSVLIDANIFVRQSILLYTFEEPTFM